MLLSLLAPSPLDEHGRLDFPTFCHSLMLVQRSKYTEFGNLFRYTRCNDCFMRKRRKRKRFTSTSVLYYLWQHRPGRPTVVQWRGMAECRSGKQFVCDVCEVGFAYPSKLKRHQRSRKHALFETVSKRTRRCRRISTLGFQRSTQRCWGKWSLLIKISYLHAERYYWTAEFGRWEFAEWVGTGGRDGERRIWNRLPEWRWLINVAWGYIDTTTAYTYTSMTA